MICVNFSQYSVARSRCYSKCNKEKTTRDYPHSDTLEIGIWRIWHCTVADNYRQSFKWINRHRVMKANLIWEGIVLLNHCCTDLTHLQPRSQALSPLPPLRTKGGRRESLGMRLTHSWHIEEEKRLAILLRGCSRQCNSQYTQFSEIKPYSWLRDKGFVKTRPQFRVRLSTFKYLLNKSTYFMRNIEGLGETKLTVSRGASP